MGKETLLGEEAQDKHKELEKTYRAIIESTPVISGSDNAFLQSKYQLMRKIWISKELDKKTGETVRDLRKRYKRQKNK